MFESPCIVLNPAAGNKLFCRNKNIREIQGIVDLLFKSATLNAIRLWPNSIKYQPGKICSGNQFTMHIVELIFWSKSWQFSEFVWVDWMSSLFIYQVSMNVRNFLYAILLIVQILFKNSFILLKSPKEKRSHIILIHSRNSF